MSVIVIMDRFSTYSATALPVAIVKVPEGKMARDVFKGWYESHAKFEGTPMEKVLESINYAEYDVLGE